MVIDSGNYSGQSYTVTEPTRIEAGNWVGADLANPDGHPVTLAGGNLRGLRFADAAPTGPGDLPVWVTLAGGVLHYGWTPPPVLEPLPLAARFVAALVEAGGPEMLAAWEEGARIILDAPAGLTLAGWKAAHIAWAEATLNTVYSGAAFRRAAAYLLGLDPAAVTDADWPALRDLVRSYDVATWRGEPTQPVGMS